MLTVRKFIREWICLSGARRLAGVRSEGNESSVNMPSGSSRIFTGFRALGFVSNHVPLAVRYNKKHKENYVVTCVGNAFHTYNVGKPCLTER